MRIIEYLQAYYKWEKVNPTFIANHGDDIIQVTIIKKHQSIEIFKKWVRKCPVCNQKISLRKVRFCSAMVTWLKKALDYCEKNQVNLFLMWDLNLNQKEYARFNDIVRFWLLFKDKEFKKAGMYGMPVARVKEFFKWSWKVAEFYLNDPTKSSNDPQKRIMSDRRIPINEIPWITKLLEETNNFKNEYYNNPFRTDKITDENI